MDISPAIQYLLGHHNNAPALAGIDVILFAIKNIISLIGTIVILIGALFAIYRYCLIKFSSQKAALSIDAVRVQLGQAIVLGLEFIVAADIIETTTAPDYYSVGILCIVVAVRTFLNYFLNKEIMELEAQTARG